MARRRGVAVGSQPLEPEAEAFVLRKHLMGISAVEVGFGAELDHDQNCRTRLEHPAGASQNERLGALDVDLENVDARAVEGLIERDGLDRHVAVDREPGSRASFGVEQERKRVRAVRGRNWMDGGIRATVAPDVGAKDVERRRQRLERVHSTAVADELRESHRVEADVGSHVDGGHPGAHAAVKQPEHICFPRGVATNPGGQLLVVTVEPEAAIESHQLDRARWEQRHRPRGQRRGMRAEAPRGSDRTPRLLLGAGRQVLQDDPRQRGEPWPETDPRDGRRRLARSRDGRGAYVISLPVPMATDQPPAATPDAVVSHHLDGFRSGVARFNDLLARGLGVPFLGLHTLDESSVTHPLLSFKVAELESDAVESVEAWLASGRDFDVFLHVYDGHELERRLVTAARRVLCGNDEIAARLAGVREGLEVLWAPGLIADDRTFAEAEITVFSFGMAHKLRTDMFGRLRDLLDSTGRSYAVYVSAANHETSSIRDAELVFEEMHAIFPGSMFFLGNLSDVAVVNQLRSTTFFATFFAGGGVRANNTSVAAALEHGAVVITNLDRFSPPELVHLDNVIDLERCERLPDDPLVLQRISIRARETARVRTWSHLIARVRGG